MKKVVLLAVCVGLVASLAQAAILSEDWETGTDGWVDYGAGPFATLSDAQNTTPGGSWSLKTADTTTSYTNAKDWNFAVETGKNWYVQWEMYDTGSSREYMQVQSYAGTTLQQLVAFGTYNGTGGGSSYYARVAVGGGNWMLTDIPRTNNTWHTFRIEQDDATGTITFSVDGDEWTATTTAVFGATKLRVGSGLGNASHGAYYDDIEFGIVPEPAVAVLFGLGGLLFGRRRRMA